MEKTRKWRKILAMMLTVVMMLQNAQSVMVFADVTNEQIEQRLAGNQGQTEETQPAQSQVDTRANGEEYKTQSQETQENGNGSTDIGSPESGNTTTEAKTSNADVSATITQSMFQADVSGITCNFVQMTAQITNNDAENPATGVSVKALLNSAQLSWVNGYGTETAGAGAYAVDSNNTADLPDGSADGYDQIVMWTDQTIGAGETVAYQFAAQIIPENLDGVVNAWYVDGTSCSYTWENTEILVPTQAPVEPAPEVAPPQTEPEEKPEVKPEETTPEVTEAPEVTPTPEVTEVPEATPTPEVTEVPEATPTPEVTEVPEVTPTPEPTQAVDDDKQAKLDEQNKLLGQSKDRLKIKKAKAPKAQAGDGNTHVATVADEQGYTDLSDYLNSVDLKVQGNPYEPNNKIADNGMFEISLSFGEITNGRQFPENGKLKYSFGNLTVKDKDGNTLPVAEYIKAYEDYQNVPIYKKGTKDIIGYYDVDVSSGTVYVKLNTDDGTGKNPITEHTNYTAELEFSGKFNASVTGDKDEIKIDFGNNVEKTIKFEHGNPVTGEKKVSSYDPLTGEFTFIVSVIADRKANKIAFADTFGDALQLVPGSIRVVSKDNYTKTNETSKSVIDSNYAKGIVDNTITETANGFAGEFTNVEAGSEYYIMYKAKIKDSAIYGSVGQIQNLDNTVQFTIDDKYTADATKAGQYKHEWVQKKEPEMDTETGKIKWTVVVNPGAEQKVEGFTVKDILQSDLSAYDKTTPVQVKAYQLVEDSSSEAGYKKELVEGYPKDLQWNTDINLSDGDKSWTYTIPGSNKYEYEFSYYTLCEVGTDASTLTNDAVVIKDTKELDSSSKSITIPGTGDGTGSNGKNLNKEFVKFENVNDVKYAEWKATFSVPKGGLKNVVFKDKLSGANHTLPASLTDRRCETSDPEQEWQGNGRMDI